MNIMHDYHVNRLKKDKIADETKYNIREHYKWRNKKKTTQQRKQDFSLFCLVKYVRRQMFRWTVYPALDAANSSNEARPSPWQRWRTHAPAAPCNPVHNPPYPLSLLQTALPSLLSLSSFLTEVKNKNKHFILRLLMLVIFGVESI